MKKLALWAIPLLFVFSTSAVLAQSTNAGDIRGSATDSTGAVMAGVTVTVTNVETGVTKSLMTNQAGLFDTDSIITGQYTVSFTKDGFEKLVRGPVTINVGFTTVNGEMKVGATSQTVEVTADVPLLQTETSEQSTTFESKSMKLLPQITPDWENFMIICCRARPALQTDRRVPRTRDRKSRSTATCLTRIFWLRRFDHAFA